MFKEILDYYQSARLRSILIDLSLICFIIGMLALSRFLFLIADEAHQFRIDFDTQAGSLTTAIQMGTSQLSSNLNDLNVSGKVITSRLDSQITSVKALLHNAATRNELTSRQEIATTRNAIKDSIDTAKDAIQTVAAQTSEVAAKPVQVTLQPAKTETKPPSVTVQLPDAPQPQPRKKRSAWGKLCHFLFHLKD